MQSLSCLVCTFQFCVVRRSERWRLSTQLAGNGVLPGLQILGYYWHWRPSEESLISYRCPYCSSDFAGSALLQPAGIGGGSFCPNCQERVRVSFPYARLAVVLSIVLA